MLNAQRLFSISSRTEILVIDIEDEAIRAIVVQKRGKDVSVVRSARLQTGGDGSVSGGAHDHLFSQSQQHDEVQQFRDLLERLGRHPRNVYVVSSEAKFLVSELPIAPGAKVAYNKLKEAVRWEAQTYLDYSAEQGLFSYHLQNGKYSHGQHTGVLISAISRENYIHLRDVLKQVGLQLSGIIPSEGAFIFSVNSFPKRTKERVVLNVNNAKNTISGALLNSGNPVTFQTATLDNAAALTKGLIAMGSHVTDIVVTGDQDDDIRELCRTLKNKSDISVRPWQIHEDIQTQQPNVPSEFGASYAAAVGAALQALNGGRRGDLVVDDREPLRERVQTRFHLLPLIVALLVTGLLIAQYTLMRTDYWRHEQMVKELKAERKDLKKDIDELSSVEMQITDIFSKRRYVEETLSVRHKRLLDFFDGIVREIPYDIILDRISQDGENDFFLEGSGLSAGSITQFTGKLDRIKNVNEAKLEVVNERIDARESSDMFFYEFKIRITLR